MLEVRGKLHHAVAVRSEPGIVVVAAGKIFERGRAFSVGRLQRSAEVGHIERDGGKCVQIVPWVRGRIQMPGELRDAVLVIRPGARNELRRTHAPAVAGGLRAGDGHIEGVEPERRSDRDEGVNIARWFHQASYEYSGILSLTVALVRNIGEKTLADVRSEIGLLL